MHDQIHDLLHQYIDGELEIMETIILEEHLATCQPCRKMLNRFKVMDWDLKHQPTVDIPPELIAYRTAAVKAHLANIQTAVGKDPIKDAWHPQKHILQHTFSFITYNPVNRTITRSVGKTVSTMARVAGSRLIKRKPMLSRLIPGQT